MKKKWVIRFLWLLVLAVAAMIFYFSAQEGEDSMRTSSGFIAFLLRLLAPGYDGMTAHEKRALIKQLQYIVRKAAHFTEFAVLGGLSYAFRRLFERVRGDRNASLLFLPLFWEHQICFYQQC